MVQHGFEVPFRSKAITCVRSYNEHSHGQETESNQTRIPSLIFTHGAGGNLASAGISNFTSGFATRLPILCFQGNINLKSRVNMFSEVMKDQKFATSLGGRSMGARAAVLAATSETENLVLASYPLHTNKDTRDQILLDISPSTKVLFIEGDKDSMCDLSRLDAVRKKMKCKTWLLVVQGADHGMSLSPKSAVAQIGLKTGEIAAEWIKAPDNECCESKVFWDEEVRWNGWTQGLHEKTVTSPSVQPKQQKRTKRTEQQDEKKASTRKRRKV